MFESTNPVPTSRFSPTKRSEFESKRPLLSPFLHRSSAAQRAIVFSENNHSKVPFMEQRKVHQSKRFAATSFLVTPPNRVKNDTSPSGPGALYLESPYHGESESGLQSAEGPHLRKLWGFENGVLVSLGPLWTKNDSKRTPEPKKERQVNPIMTLHIPLPIPKNFPSTDSNSNSNPKTLR